MPQLAETVVEGVVTKWYKKVGDSAKADETPFDVETDKVSTEIPAPVSGVIAAILVQEGVTAKVGAPLAVIEEAGAKTASAPRETAAPAAAAAAASPASLAPRFAPAAAGDRLSPVVRRLIAEHQLNPAEIKGSGRDGRITREAYANARANTLRNHGQRCRTCCRRSRPIFFAWTRRGRRPARHGRRAMDSR